MKLRYCIERNDYMEIEVNVTDGIPTEKIEEAIYNRLEAGTLVVPCRGWDIEEVESPGDYDVDEVITITDEEL